MKTVLRRDAIEIIKIVRQLIDNNNKLQIYLNDFLRILILQKTKRMKRK